MPKPKWMRAERGIADFDFPGDWKVYIDGWPNSYFIFKDKCAFYAVISEVKFLAAALGLTVKGDLKKSIKSGLIEFRRK